MIPSVRRANPPSVAARCTSRLCVLPEALQEDVETLDGTGMLKSAAAAGGHGGTMALIVSALQPGA